MLILKVDQLFIVIPLTITKVETRMRNVIINGKPKFDGLSRFMKFYLSTLATKNTTIVKPGFSKISAKVAHGV